MKEIMGGRTECCVYQAAQEANLIHMASPDKKNEQGRMLTHFYSFMLLEDWRHDVFIKRFVRDNIHYNDEIQCAAARTVEAMQEQARQHGDSEGNYDSFHVRRGKDFKFA